MKEPTIYFGPPGTGKTTKLLDIVALLLDDSFPSRQIAFISFTRKAATEAKTRAVEKFGIHPDNFPWFRTLHSMAFHQLGMNQREVMGMGDYFKLAGELGLSLTFRQVADGDTTMGGGLSKGDRLFFMENMARATKMDLRQYWEESPNEDIYWYELERLQQTLVAYKRDTGKRDFTDIVSYWILNPVMPDHRVLIVDEAQDLTPLQWEMVDILAEQAEEMFVAGDDDQAIFRWAGADVDRIINMVGNRIVLPQSYRVPQAVQEIAKRITDKITKRVPKVWHSRPAPGSVEYHNQVAQIDMSKGTWLLLGRNIVFLDMFMQHCMREGFVFESQHGSPIRTSSFRAIRNWEELRKGETITVSEACEVYDQMSTKVGVKYGMKTHLEREEVNRMIGITELREKFGLMVDTVWHEALDKLTAGEVQYFIAALKRGEKLLKAPRIKISTIHAVKGGEADHVALLTDMAERTWKEFEKNPDDEHRVWYVAVTRARESLHIIAPVSKRCYEL